jgi:hypothetical protein
MSILNVNTTIEKEEIDDDEPQQKETLLTSASSWTKWKNLDLNETKSLGKKHLFDDLFLFIQENFKLEKSFERTRFILSLIKILAHSFVLIYIALIFILHYLKCFRHTDLDDVNDEFLSNFTAKLPYNINETIHLRIKFCSPLYDNQFYLDRDHFTFLAHFFEYTISKCVIKCITFIFVH